MQELIKMDSATYLYNYANFNFSLTTHVLSDLHNKNLEL